jgi:Rrf2 family iron-sulfur cluster assembly transcriptional regulator
MSNFWEVDSMRFTKRTIYALQALVDIANQKTDRPVKLRGIAERAGVSERFLEQILGGLTGGGILGSRRGPVGGYCLRKPAEEINLYDVLLITEGPIQVVPCVGAPNPSQEECLLSGRCPAGPVWGEIHSQMVEVFRSRTLRDLCG